MPHCTPFIAVLLGLVFAVGTASAQVEEIRAPELPSLIPEAPDAPNEAVSPARGPLAKLPPPAPAACVSDAEYNAAMAGTGCDCSCEGYARGPDRRCMVVCGLPYYACWAPDPTEVEITEAGKAAYADTLDSLPPEVRESVKAEITALTANEEWRLNTRGGLMLQRADAWDQARRCTAD